MSYRFIDLEQTIRPYDFGTDAIERVRVAQPVPCLMLTLNTAYSPNGLLE